MSVTPIERAPAPTPTKTRKWQLLALFVLMSLVFAILAVEVIARFVLPKLADDRSYFDTIDRQILDVRPLYYAKDGHPNPAGCRRIAEASFDQAFVGRLRTEQDTRLRPLSHSAPAFNGLPPGAGSG